MKPEIKPNSLWKSLSCWLKAYQVLVLLLGGLLIGLVFVFTVPPWMHYDEPGHFEYAWLIANRPGLPVRGDYDQAMRRQVAASIVEQDIEAYAGMVSDPLQIDAEIDIWLAQVEDHPPTYYLLAALPLMIFRHTDITFQLYLVRLVSLTLFLLTIWAAYKACLELFGTKHPLTWLVPFFLLTLPAFVDIMTAANNDVAANLAFTLFIWASVLAIKKGLADFRLPALIGAVFLCLFTKSTAWLAVPLSLLVVLLALLRGHKRQKVAWLALVGSLVIAGLLAVSWRETAPAYYYGLTSASTPSRVAVADAPVGENAIVQGSRVGSFYHHLSAQKRTKLAGEVATLGAWIWADQPTTISFPSIRESQIWIPMLTASPTVTRERIPFPSLVDRQTSPPVTILFSPALPIQLTTTPQFFAFNTSMPPLGGNVSWVHFPSSADEDNRVYWDGLVLVPGDFTGAEPPQFDDSTASSGTWSGQSFNNLIRNASGESAWPVFAPWLRSVVDIPNRIVPSASLILSFLDYDATAAYFQLAGERILRTFWAVFGWANVPLHGQKPYRFFLFLTVFYLIGILIAGARKAWGFSTQILLLMVGAVFFQFLIVVFRGIGSWFWLTYIPVGRYLYPVILPLGILLMAGVDQWISILHRLTRVSRQVFYLAFSAFLMGILLWSVLSLRHFFTSI